MTRKRWTAMAAFVVVISALAGAVALHPQEARIVAQAVAVQFVAPGLPQTPLRPAAAQAEPLIAAAESQVGVTLHYDPSYVRLAFPGGDVARDVGVCTDVVIRAVRAAFGIDLQVAVNRDMAQNFGAYPALWGLTRPDANIDHRRVPNLETLLRRAGAELAPASVPEDFAPGDIVTSRLPGNRPHIMIVSARVARDGTPLVVHNIGAGVRVEDALYDFPHVARFRLTPEVLAALSAISAQ
ncbi:MAG: DUF1287 domain-containing protein [Rhodobacteraceae bacterium]|nr:DUF1287 domain-containing protein [Paracoccaceae bacterium]MCB2123035.1 DUF1287 domain-containing protein [Paracoccaceae bacterium]MCB2133113.1 DUF1287 domain-containing protein [Paracoccaceae bacterium]MCB2138299.1 DUF1287 domain-containing protein [Paracoccaceae bacterium]MCB2142891.1 DUF1287 domain-containing protein [Paracoccaceae bacterium]